MKFEMEFEDIYEIVIRIQNTRLLLVKGDIEGAEKVLLNLENDLRGVIYPNNPSEILDANLSELLDSLRGE